MDKTINWPQDEDALLVQMSEGQGTTLLLDANIGEAFRDYWQLQPINSVLRPRAEVLDSDAEDLAEWISVDLAWIAAGVTIAAISAITTILCTAMHKGYKVDIDFGEKTGHAKVLLKR